MTTLDFFALSTGQRAQLVSTALAGQRRVARSGRYYLQPLANAGWLCKVRETPAGYTIYEVTEEGRAALLATIPDDYQQDFFPLPRDIAKMKAKLRQLDQGPRAVPAPDDENWQAEPPIGSGPDEPQPRRQ